MNPEILTAMYVKYKDTPMYDRWAKIVTKISVLHLMDDFKNIEVKLEQTGNCSATVRMWDGEYKEKYETL